MASFRKPTLDEFPYFQDEKQLIKEVNEEFLVPGCREPDCIPSIDRPNWITGKEGLELWEGTDKVLVTFDPEDPSQTYAAPIKVMNLHEIINFEFPSGKPVALTYCPLCDTSSAVLRQVEGNRLELGVSGLLYNSAVIIYDRDTQSLFSQVLNKGIHGKFRDLSLKRFPVVELSLSSYVTQFPSGSVLSDDTGFPKRKNRYRTSNHYDDYKSSDRIAFPISDIDNELPLKSRVYHLERGGDHYIISHDLLTENSGAVTEGLYYKNYLGDYLFFSTDGNKDDIWEDWIPSMISYYFAARSYFPDAKLLH